MKKNKQKKKHILLYILSYWFVSITIVMICLCNWLKSSFSFGINEIIYTLISPLDGTDTGMVSAGLRECLPIVLVLMLVVAALWILDYRKHLCVQIGGMVFGIKCRVNLRVIAFLLSILSVLAGAWYWNVSYDISSYMESAVTYSTFYEEYYTDPDSVEIRAMGETKNLLLIYLESMENTYLSKEEGGAQNRNLLPGLTALAKENVSFSQNEKIGGFSSVNGTTWTVGALFATSTGAPFSLSKDVNGMSENRYFAPGITALGDILQEKGYTQEFLCGSDAAFGGRDKFYTQHGNYEIFDLFTAQQAGYLPSAHYNNGFWGYEDKYLYEIAKDELNRLWKKGKPFNLTMLTVDTHAIDGYVCELCEMEEDVATSVVCCADRQITAFINWCKMQPFYEDTAIVIIGDHPRMDNALVSEVEYLDRTVYNCFINAVPGKAEAEKNRLFTAMDVFPTILAAMGYTTAGEQLGLGVNLFSGKPTLAEELGFHTLNQEIAKQSLYYNVEFNKLDKYVRP